jgi:hypothetical protein
MGTGPSGSASRYNVTGRDQGAVPDKPRDKT